MNLPENIFISVRNSLFAVCKIFRNDMKDAGYPDQSIYNFDAYSEDNQLPVGDLVGLHSFSLKLDTELAIVSLMFGISTQDDENLFRLDTLTGLFLKRVLPGTSIPIYDSENSTPTVVGQLKISAGVDVSPVLRAIQRPVKFIAVQGMVSLPVQAQ